MITLPLVPRDRFRADWYEALRRRGATHEAVASVTRRPRRAPVWLLVCANGLGLAIWWVRRWCVWVGYVVRGFSKEFWPSWWALRPGGLPPEELEERLRRAEEASGLRPRRPLPPPLPGDRHLWH